MTQALQVTLAKKELVFTPSFDPPMYSESCYCNSCYYLMHKPKIMSHAFLLGILFPPLWLYNFFILGYGVIWLGWNEKHNRNQYHEQIRKVTITRFWYTLAAAVVYSVLSALYIYSVLV